LRFGSILTFGYDRLGHFSLVSLDARSPGVFVSLLVGPGFGLFVLSPVLALAIYGARQLYVRDRWYAVGTLVGLLSCYVFFSCWHDSYTGGVVWGTRYQCHLLPLFVVPLTLGLQSLAARPSARRVAIGVVALSVAVQALSVFATHHLEYGQATCEGMADAPLRNSFVHGQLERRATNLVRWLRGEPPPPLPDPDGACAQTVHIVWDRYVPNFWGPVFARRLQRGRGALLGIWCSLLFAALWLVVMGVRRELASSRPGARPLVSSGP
ncbi:MAG TPA: hypothetical protein VKU41_10780, partial [Polyangiaceae bacterium]|nr:hypothetical protein [Polyangiaceae bacterium]